MHDEALADDYFKAAEFCSMCGPMYCPMHNFRGVGVLSTIARSERNAWVPTSDLSRVAL